MKSIKHDKVEIPPTIRKSERKRLGIRPSFAQISLQDLMGFLTGTFLMFTGIFMVILPFFASHMSVLVTTLLTISGCFSFLLGTFWMYFSVSSKKSVQKLTHDAIHRIVRDQN